MAGNRHRPECPCRFCRKPKGGFAHRRDCECSYCKPLSGEASPHAKLTEAAVRQIRAHTRYSLRQLAAIYGVSCSTISVIRHRKKWKHV